MKRTATIVMAVLILLAAAAVAMETPKDAPTTASPAGGAAASAPQVITGKVYLRGGKTYEGQIEMAEFGVVEGAGIGSQRALSNDYFAVEVNGETVKVPVADIATVEADWQQVGTEAAKKWQINSLTITKRDGTKITGKIGWMLNESTVTIKQADGTIARAHAFPVANPDFDPSQLLVKIELGGAVTLGAATPPAPPAPAPPAPAEAPGTTPAPPPAPAPAPPAPAPTPPAPTPAAGTPATILITIICPHCGEKITIEVPVVAKSGG